MDQFKSILLFLSLDFPTVHICQIFSLLFTQQAQCFALSLFIKFQFSIALHTSIVRSMHLAACNIVNILGGSIPKLIHIGSIDNLKYLCIHSVYFTT